MGTKTIHTLAYKILVDTEHFSKGMKTTKAELASAKREMRAMLAPAEKMELSLHKLGELAKKDARFQELYNRKLKQYQTEVNKTTGLTRLWGSVSGKAKLAIAGLSAAAVGFATRGIFQNVNRQIDRIDALSKSANNLGISIEDLTRLQFTASKASGLTNEATAKGIEKMVRRVSEAAIGTGEAGGVLEEIGLDAGTIAAMSPVDEFIAIARAMDSVTEEHDRVRIATKIFDDEQSRMHLTLRLTNEELQAQFDLADKLRRTISTFDASEVQAAKDAMTDMASAFEAFSTQFAITLAPALTETLAQLTGLMASMPGNQEGDGSLTSGDYLMGGVQGLFADVGGVKSYGELFERVAKASIHGAFASRTGREVRQGQMPQRLEANKTQAAKLAEAKAIADAEESAQKKREADQKKADEDREKMLQEALRLTESVRTAEEKHAATLADINKLRMEGNVSQETLRRLTLNADADLKSDLIGRIRGSVDSKEKTTGVETFREGPLSSVAAGSSEAFAVLNQTAISREVEIAKEQLDYSKQSLAELKRMADAITSDPLNSGIE